MAFKDTFNRGDVRMLVIISAGMAFGRRLIAAAPPARGPRHLPLMKLSPGNRSLILSALRNRWRSPEVKQSMSWLLNTNCSSAFSLAWKILALRSYLDV